MATAVRSNAEAVEDAHRILRSLIAERRRLHGQPDAAPLAEANRIAIQYWRGVIADKLGHERASR